MDRRMVATPPPSKKEQLLKLLERGSVFVHLDPRREGVVVPVWLVKKPPLVLQLGLNFPIPIRDLEIDDAGVRCTLSFNRSPFYCILPWSAVYALVGEDGTVTVWPSELPAELVPQGEPAVRREGPRDRRGKTKETRRPRISVVPSLPPEQTEAPSAAPAAAAPAEAQPVLAAAQDEPVSRESAVSEEAPSDAAPADVAAASRPARPRPPYLRLVK
jgi:hypothetical protein